MQLFVTCDCSQNMPVTSAKCGHTVQCACGNKVNVPSFSELKESSGTNHGSARNRAAESVVAQEETLTCTSQRRLMWRYSKLLVGLLCVLLSILITYPVLQQHFDRAMYSRDLPPRLQVQEDSINAVLLKHFKAFTDGSRPEEIRERLKYEGLDYMVGKSTEEFPDVFSSAYTLAEYQEHIEKHRPRIRDWMKDKKSAVFLSTNIWKTVGGVVEENTHDADVLAIALKGDVIKEYKFFANIGY